MFDFSARRTELKARLENIGLAGALITHSRDVYYYTGLAQPACLALFSDQPEGTERLFVRAGMDMARANVDLDPASLEPMRHRAEAAAKALPCFGQGPIGLALDTMTAIQAAELAKALENRPLENISAQILDQRAVKQEAEQELMAASALAVDAGHQAAVATIGPGVTELELAAEVERAIRLAGHCGTNFMRQPDFAMGHGPLASGGNLVRHSGMVYTISGVGLSAALPAGPSRREMKTGDLIVIDIPACVAGYHCDQSRTYSVGPASARALDLFEALKTVLDNLAANLRPGMKAGQAYDLALKEAASVGLKESFCSFADGRKAHFVGHGIGLEVNEPPLLARQAQSRLKEDMTLALEVHALQGNTVVKLEDTTRLTDRGCRIINLTPRKLIEV